MSSVADREIKTVKRLFRRQNCYWQPALIIRPVGFRRFASRCVIIYLRRFQYYIRQTTKRVKWNASLICPTRAVRAATIKAMINR